MPDPQFDELVASLTRGEEPRSSMLAVLSDLDRERASTLRDAWPAIPPAVREAVVSEAALLAADDVGYDFERLMLLALVDAEPVVRRLAAAGLGESSSREAGRLLTGLLQSDDDSSVRRAAAGALAGFVADWAGRRGFAEACHDVLATLRLVASLDQSVEVRARAIVAAAGASEPWLAPVLEDAYYSEERVLRLAAIEAMGQTCDEQWIEYLLEQFGAEDAEVRLEAATACGELGSEDAVEPLATLAGDDDPDVSAAAVVALARIGGSLVLDVLNDLKADPPPGLDLEILEIAIAETRESLQPLGSREDE